MMGFGSGRSSRSFKEVHFFARAAKRGHPVNKHEREAQNEQGLAVVFDDVGCDPYR